MPEVEVGLVARLLGYAPLTALIGNRVYPGSAPQNAVYPFVLYQRISSPRITAMGVDPGLARPRFQLTVMAKADIVTAHKNAKNVVIQVRAALRRFKGTVAGVVIQDIFLEDENDIEVPDTSVHGVALDILIWHGE